MLFMRGAWCRKVPLGEFMQNKSGLFMGAAVLAIIAAGAGYYFGGGFKPAGDAAMAPPAAETTTASTPEAAPAPTTGPAPEAAPAPAREQVSWDLTRIYPDVAAFDADIAQLETEVDSLAAFAGTMGNDADSLYAALDASSVMMKRVARAAVYASLRSDEDLRDSAERERSQRGDMLFNRFVAATAYMDPEILAIGAEKIAAFRASHAELDRRFGFYLDNTLRGAAHTLDAEGEAILAAMNDALSQPSNVYGIFANAELPFPTVTLSDGTSMVLDQAAYSALRQAPNREDRKLVFNTFWGAWKDYEGTLGANLASAIIGNVTVAKLRGFPNALSAALFNANIPEGVYRTLVQVTNESLPTLHRYFKLRKRMLGITDDMGYFDIYPPMVTLDKTFTLQDSQDLLLVSVAPLGDDYVTRLSEAFSRNVQHVYPAEGKTSGAYMNGWVYDSGPFILLNHNDDYESASTFAHEWGHGMHTILANANQPWETARYSTFTAEMAAITNELLMQEHVFANAASREEKLYYLGMALEGIRGTYFRQTMFAEFQLAAHEVVERGEPLSGARLTAIYCDLLKRYHGDAEGVLKINEDYCVEWAFIPHFYRGFYVYNYATSIAGAAYFANEILTKGEAARENYLDILRAGGSDYAYELYKRAGIDMATRAPYEALMARANKIMDEMEALLAQQP